MKSMLTHTASATNHNIDTLIPSWCRSSQGPCAATSDTGPSSPVFVRAGDALLVTSISTAGGAIDSVLTEAVGEARHEAPGADSTTASDVAMAP